MTSEKRQLLAKKRFSLQKLFSLCLVCLAANVPAAQPGTLLWQIGKPDHNNAEFALAPDGYRQFTSDGLFVVGESDARRDWPYVHPGPVDDWAGGRQHTFTIFFGLKRAPSSGECRLRLDLLDTQSKSPPVVRIQINGQIFERPLPEGAGDESVNGQPAKGKEHKCAIQFPASVLKSGDNAVEITTLSGSWLLYDWVGLETPPGAELTRVQARTVVEQMQPLRALKEKDGKSLQPILATLRHFGVEAEGVIRVEGTRAVPIHITNGLQTIEVLAPAASEVTQRTVTVEVGGRLLATRSVTLKPARKLTIYVLPHSHTDIGYTEIQTAIEKKQVNNLLEGIECARKTAGYPEGARFVWNVEVLWAADLYLHRLSGAQRAEFTQAVKKGWVALNGMYLNELTGLCRPEELLRLFRYSNQLAEQCGVTIDAAMISDVPGYTWGTVTAMAQAGMKYFSVAPNFYDRIGDILVKWENKPFYWVSPSGKEKVLVWIPFKGYAMSHIYKKLTPEFAAMYQAQLESTDYPYDISYMRWSGHGDNATPDPAICEFIKEWNTKYSWPKFIIASTSEAFRAFEQRYGSKVPQARGDWTPYWEDGAGSSALETAVNRGTADRLTQAEALWAMLNPAGYPAAAFDEAWRNVLLYSEHTWGADCSVSDPENQKTKEQWEIKRSYAVQADAQSRKLLDRALMTAEGKPASAIDVYNTVSWARTDLVLVSKELSAAGDRVTDDRGQAVPSQRLASGELAFLARDVPPFAARRYTMASGSPPDAGGTRSTASAMPAVLDNGLLRVRVDEKTGGIVELRARDIDANLADTASGHALNDYVFLAGDNLADLQGSGPVKNTVKERGPLVASLLVESAAPGCRRLTREIRLVAESDQVELIDTVDKERSPVNPKPGDWHFAQTGGKESVNFAFAFNVPGGDMQLDLPLAIMRPELDQLAGACKNWFTVGRWVDVANQDYGITWVTLDAPLVEIGGITARLLGSQANPDVWRKKVEPTQTLYSWVMNNHWGTNYRAYQEGPVVFRYVLRPHRKSSPDAATRLATGLSQPLIATRAGDPQLSATPRLRLSTDEVVVTAFKPSDDGKAWIVRLFGASGKDATVNLFWGRPGQLWLSDTSERPLQKINDTVPVPALGLVTLRAEQAN